jgi:hypothetical protein
MPTRRPPNLESEIDSLFQLPLAEFTSARNALAARLKKDGRADDAERVKGMAKASAPAWAVNQLFWENPKAFDQLLAIADRVRKAQTGQTKNADLGGLLAEKKRMTAELLRRATSILGAAGHAASPEVMRRVSGTLEALAVWGKADGGPRAGRLTAELDPPGFEALGAFMVGKKVENVLTFRPKPKPKPAVEDPKVVRARAREAVQEAEKALREARQVAAQAERAMLKANARTAAIEKEKEEIEAKYVEAKEEGRTASNEAKKAMSLVEDAEKAVTRAKAELAGS